MKNKSLLPILLLATFALSACNVPGQSSESKEEAGTSQEVQPSSVDTTEYGVAIANKEALQGEWYAGTTRDLDVTLSPAANPLTELGKNLTIESSDAEVVKVTGLGLSALKAGSVTITVKYHEATDTVAVTILDNSAKAKYGVAHEGTAADPFTNEDALAVAKSEKYEGEVYYVKGKVASFYNAPGSRTDGMVAYYLEPAQSGGEKFEIYKCFKEDGSALTDDDIWVGGEATAYGAFTKYNTQYETSSAIFVSCEGNKPEARKTLTKTFAETFAAGAALADGADTYDYYKFQGYVTKKSGNNYFLTATKGEALVEATSDEAHGSKKYYTNAIELYNAGTVAELVAKLLENAKVEVTMVVKNYHGTVENGLNLADADVTVLEAGTAWAVPEPAVGAKTLAEFIALENSKAKAYNVTATVKSWKNATAEKDKYGNMVLTDGTNDLVIYGASATATALAWDNSEAYAFKNPQDFLTNEVTKALNIGDEVTMKLIRADYNGTVQGTGVITKVTPAGTPAASLELATSIAVGDKLVLSAETEKDGAAVKKQFNGIIASGSNKIGEAVDYAGDKPAADVAVLDVVAGSAANTFALKLGDKYLVWKSGNTLDSQDAVDANASWAVTFADGKATIVNGADSARKLQYNAGSPRFATYTSAQTAVTLWKVTGGAAPAPVASYPTFKWSEAIQEGSSALDGTKFNKNATYNLKVENVPAAGDYTVTLPMMGSDGNGAKTFCTTGTANDGQGFSISANDVAGTILVAGKTYTEVFGSDQKAWVDVLFAKVTLKAGSNIISLKTNGGGYRVSVKADGNITIAEAPVEIAQPTGTFFGSVEITDAGKTALSAAGNIVPVFITLTADSASVSVNGASAGAASIKSYDKATGNLVITTANFGDLSMTYNPETTDLEKLSVVANTGILKYDGGQALKGNDKLKYWNCDGSTEELQAQFVRRYNNPWTADTGNADRVVKDETNFKSGSGAKVRAWKDGRIALAVKDFDAKFNARNLSFWVYNPGEADISLQAFAYKGTGYSDYVQIFSGKAAVAGQWTYISVGLTAADVYAFQIVVPNGTSTQLTFDDICLY